MPRIKRGRYVIIVDSPSQPPFFVKVDRQFGIPSLALAVSEKPPKSFSYSEDDTPILLERLKSEFPDAAIQAVAISSLDHEALAEWWEARIATLKAAREFAEFASHKRGDRSLH